MSSDKIPQTLIEEAETWCIKDDNVRHDKIQRETARYPYLIKNMGLSAIDTSPMVIVDIGGGPVGVSHALPSRKRIVIDPLTDEYREYFPCTNHIKGFGESLPFNDNSIDLVIITNALDHTQNPAEVIKEVKRVLKPGGYFSHYHAINNAITHKHAAHQMNVNPEWMHEELDTDFETVWELKYPEIRYGWHEYNGKIGQPAFCGLFRKVTGYA